MFRCRPYRDCPFAMHGEQLGRAIGFFTRPGEKCERDVEASFGSGEHGTFGSIEAVPTGRSPARWLESKKPNERITAILIESNPIGQVLQPPVAPRPQT